jgi:GxxExxY protein
MEVHRTLGPGFLESVYEEALCYEFTVRKTPFERQVELPVYYKGVELGKYYADLVVDQAIVLEIKAVSAFSDRHSAHALHYLTATSLRLAVLINFGTRSLQTKRIVSCYYTRGHK